MIRLLKKIIIINNDEQELQSENISLSLYHACEVVSSIIVTQVYPFKKYRRSSYKRKRDNKQWWAGDQVISLTICCKWWRQMILSFVNFSNAFQFSVQHRNAWVKPNSWKNQAEDRFPLPSISADRAIIFSIFFYFQVSTYNISKS